MILYNYQFYISWFCTIFEVTYIDIYEKIFNALDFAQNLVEYFYAELADILFNFL